MCLQEHLPVVCSHDAELRSAPDYMYDCKVMLSCMQSHCTAVNTILSSRPIRPGAAEICCLPLISSAQLLYGSDLFKVQLIAQNSMSRIELHSYGVIDSMPIPQYVMAHGPHSANRCLCGTGFTSIKQNLHRIQNRNGISRPCRYLMGGCSSR